MQPIQQRQKTSIFSEFENNSDNSVTSKQLQYWLMHMAPTSHASPKFNQHQNQDWNLMSTSSRYESDGMTFGQRIDTFESANKENFMSRGNLILVMDDVNKTKPPTTQINHHYESTKQEKLTKSKSYINAMQQLQKRAKTLQQQNATMRRSLLLLQEEKRSSLQSSVVFEQEMRSQVFKFSQTDKKNEQLKRENKKLRDGRNQQSMKVKLMEKVINEHKVLAKQFEERLNVLSTENVALKKQLQESHAMTKSLLLENKQLVVRVQTLENMRQKSTNSILEKYGKSLERIQELQLAISEMKNKANVAQTRVKKTIEQKDQKYLASLESINGIKLQKEQLTMRLQNCISQLQDKSKRLSESQRLVREMEHNQLQANKNIQQLNSKIKQSENNYQKLSATHLKLQLKYNSLKEEMKSLETVKLKQQQNQYKRRQMNNQRLLKNQDNQPIEEEYFSQAEMQQDKQQSDQQQNEVPMKTQQSTPVEKYDDNEQNNYQQFQQEQYIKYTRPLSMIKNAKNTQPKIRDQIENDGPNTSIHQFEQQQVSSEEQSLQNEPQNFCPKKISDQYRNESNTIKVVESRKRSIQLKQNSKQKKKIKDKVKQQTKSRSKDSKNSQSGSVTLRHKSPKQKDTKSKQQPTKVSVKKHSIVANESLSRSKSSSVQRMSSKERKSISVDSKRQSINNNKSTNKKKELQSQSRLIIDGGRTSSNYNETEYLYQSAQPSTKYQSANEHYFYSGEINTRQPYMRSVEPHSFYHTPAHQHQQQPSVMISQQQSKTQLNKALLLEYQEQALKLYEQHERLLELSQNENISTQQKAQILGRIRQVMTMIDHNTQKIFSIKGNIQ